MIKTIQEALAPLFIIGSFCGAGFLECPLGRFKPHVICLFFFIKWCLYMYLLYYVVLICRATSYYTTLSDIIEMFAQLLSMVVNLFCFKRLKTCMFKLAIVDNTLEVLGVPKDYQRLYNWTIQIIIIWSIMVCFTDASDSVWICLEYFSIIRIFLPSLANHLHHINTFSTLIWGIILRYISSRYQEINEHLHNLLEHDAEHTERRNKFILITQRETETKEYRKCMWTLMHVHLQLSIISRELNKVFSIQMTLQMASYFAFFVEWSRIFYTSYINNNTVVLAKGLDRIFVSVWAITYSAKFIILNYICQIVCDKANETLAILHKLSNNSSNKDLRKQTLQFILQIKQREVKFSGMGLFYFGYNFIRQFYISVATVTVIIIQMQIVVIYDDTIYTND